MESSYYNNKTYCFFYGKHHTPDIFFLMPFSNYELIVRPSWNQYLAILGPRALELIENPRFIYPLFIVICYELKFCSRIPAIKCVWVGPLQLINFQLAIFCMNLTAGFNHILIILKTLVVSTFYKPVNKEEWMSNNKRPNGNQNEDHVFVD